MKLWQCSVCARVGLWGPAWNCYSNFLIDDECPSQRIVTCSDACKETSAAKIKDGTMALPILKLRGYSCIRKRGPVGYKPQPDQRTLIELWNEAHPQEAISTAFAR